jgi:anti-anti-sigma factor
MTAKHAAEAPSRVAADASPTARRPACTVAEVRGALDVTTTQALRERLFGALAPGVRLLVIDLSGVSSCDVAGLAVLIGTQHRARVHGITVRLAAAGRQVAELLRATGLDRGLTICATLADALPPDWQGLGGATSAQSSQAA